MSLAATSIRPTMNTFTRLFSCSLPSFVSGVVAAVALLNGPAIFASGVVGSVGYSNGSQNVDGLLPLSRSFLETVTSPSTLTTAASNISFRIVVTSNPLRPVSPSTPDAVADAVAAGYVTFSTNSLNFTGPSQGIPITVFVNVPAVRAGIYTYQIYTQGWPSGFSYSDIGFQINGSLTLPVGSGGGATDLPVVAISAPVNGSVISVPTGTSFPITVAMNYTVTAPTTPINASDADLAGTSLSPTVVGIGTTTATGTATIVVPAVGQYTVRATGSNFNGPAPAAFSTFTVAYAPVAPPPTVVISTPADASVVNVPFGGFPALIPLEFTATPTGTVPAPITEISADLGGTVVVLSSITGLNSNLATGKANLVVNGPGTYTVTAYGKNAGGLAQDVNSFTVNVVMPPPTVTIDTPTPNTVVTYRTGGAAAAVPFKFTARSAAGTIQTLVAKVDGVVTAFTPSGIGTNTATGTINLSYTVAGDHSLQVDATDNYGTAIPALSNFTVNVVSPTPTVVIGTPADGQIFTIPSGQTTMSIPYTFVSTSNNGFAVDSVSANLGTVTLSGVTTTGLTTALANSSGTLTGLAAGTYTLTATCVSAGISVSDSNQFTVKGGSVPPSVVINTPPAGSVYTRASGGAALSIPMTFTGTSNTAGGVITQLKASLGTTVLAVTTTNLNTAVAQGAATLSLTNAGTYTISVTAIDAYGTATASRNITVNVVQGKTICGDTFYDIDFDGHEDCGEYGIAGVGVKLLNSANVVVGTTVTDNCGNYTFANIIPGTYTVTATAPNGLSATTPISQGVVVTSTTSTYGGCGSYGGNSCVTVPKFGFGLNFGCIRTQTANCYSTASWKNDVDKTISGSNTGCTVPRTSVSCYTTNIGRFGLTPFDCISLKTASSTMAYSGTNCTSQLSKELLAAQYNYQHGCYIGGDKNLTMQFIWWGEYVSANPSKYASSYVTWAKDWMSAYNNCKGTVVAGPAP
jgi:hypothetical protein